MLLKRTLILSDKSNEKCKAVVNLENLHNKCVGTIKFFNLNFNKDNYALGIKIKEQDVIKIPLSINSEIASFEVHRQLDFDGKIVCALVDLNNIAKPILMLCGGSSDLDEDGMISNFKMKKEDIYQPDTNQQIEDIVDQNLSQDKACQYFDSCATCKYRQAFYDEPMPQIASLGQNSSLPSQKEDKEDFTQSESFYQQIKPQIDQLFKTYQTYQVLQNLVPNSKWVKVNFENDINHYVLGLIFEGDEVKYVVYGLPAANKNNPPDDLKEYAQWLPLNADDENSEGYFVVYQDAYSGESINILAS